MHQPITRLKLTKKKKNSLTTKGGFEYNTKDSLLLLHAFTKRYNDFLFDVYVGDVPS